MWPGAPCGDKHTRSSSLALLRTLGKMVSFTAHDLEPSPVTEPSAAPNTFLPRENIPSPAVRFGGHQPQALSEY